jgi:hypothetical protein
MRGTCCKCAQTKNHCIFYKQIDRLSFIICPECNKKEEIDKHAEEELSK